jgi:hypothetical protein
LHVVALTFVNTKRIRTLPAAPVDFGCARESWLSRQRGVLAAACPAARAAAGPAGQTTAAISTTAASTGARFPIIRMIPPGRIVPANPAYEAAAGPSVTILQRRREKRRQRRHQTRFADNV